jgi:hypothetical protein
LVYRVIGKHTPDRDRSSTRSDVRETAMRKLSSLAAVLATSASVAAAAPVGSALTDLISKLAALGLVTDQTRP